MTREQIIALLDGEIERLESAKTILSDIQTAPFNRSTGRKRNMTPEGRKRISDAVRHRWVKQKAAAK